ncbi:arylsulfatase [Microbacterium halotolerans]|uniref:arylsulfatase n=1 Tax=Microbacterium halotolerans TaxID=246613 RepID=UPI000E6A96B7|nr:arylsulfatase [Microbacterium halotolerans]
MTKPNVIVILADDLGYSDIAPFGGEMDTPNLDRLASRGVRMSSFYVTPRCSPSRAALLTGRHPHSVGIGVLTTDHRPNGYRGSLSLDAPTLAERLSEHGYINGLFGKWHLSSEHRTPSDTWPTRRGFDRFRGILPGASSFYQPPLVEQETRLSGDELGEGYYFTDDITASGEQFIREHASQSPFFLYMAYTAPHWPLQAREEEIAQYRDRFRKGWTALRTERLRRLDELGLVSGVDRLPPGHPTPDWSDDEADWQVERMAVYAAQVASLDQGVGRLLDALDETGAADDTIVLFLSDNGGCAEELPPGLDRFSELVCPRTTPDGREIVIGNDPAVMPGSDTTYQSYGRDWATVSNTPFRMWKRWVHEGGISTPFIASWPGGGIPAGGAISHSAGHVIDVVATVMDAVGGTHDTDGESLLSAWRHPSVVDHDRTLFWEHIGNAAVRRGSYKLVREWGSAWELYDISTDRSESEDLADGRPEMVEELAELWEAWAREHGVIPWEDFLRDLDARGISRARAVG